MSAQETALTITAQSTEGASVVEAPPAPRGLKELLEECERTLILRALAQCGGHQRRAAKALGVLPTTLNEKMRRLHLRGARASALAGAGARGAPQ